MARPLRIEFPNALYHITSRGNRREDIYLDDNDRAVFLDLLLQVRERFNWVFHSYCLMSNHYHLLVETPEANLSLGMRQLNGVYTQRFNQSHRRDGHVFQGRYKAILVQKDAYLLELSRYIVLNPVRAGMVRSAKDWRWSNYRATAGLTPVADWLFIDWLLSCFGHGKKQAMRQYRKFVADGKGQTSPLKELRNQIYLGDDAFVETLQAMVAEDKDLSEVPSVRKRRMAKPIRKYTETAGSRDEGIYLAYRSGGYTMKAISDILDYTIRQSARLLKLSRIQDSRLDPILR
jgi:REP element-mobilizing transposase RayT